MVSSLPATQTSIKESVRMAKPHENDPVMVLGYSQRRYMIDIYYEQLVSQWPVGSLVLDLGGHKANKRGNFDINRHPVQVIYSNLTTTKQPDIQSDALANPFPANVFDYVICAELLEHVPQPVSILSEVHRVLKPEGKLIITVPFMFHIHADPYDYGRYTEFFWQENLQKLGFKDIRITKHGVYWSVLAEMIRLWAYDRAKKQSPRPLWLQRLMMRGVRRFQQFALDRESRSGYTSDPFYGSFVLGYAIECTKG